MSRESSPQGSNVFPLTLVLSQSLLDRFDNRDLLDSMRRRSQVSSLTLSRLDTQKSEDRGLIVMKDRDSEKVMRCFRLFVDEHTRIGSGDVICVIMMIPDRMVAQIIGRGGKQINKFSSSSKTVISILERTFESPDRRVSIEGEHSSVEAAVREIYSMICRNRTSHPEAGMAKFIIPSNCAGFIIGREGYFTKSLRETFSVEVKIMKADGRPCSETESIVTLLGSLENCKEAVSPLLKKISEAMANIDTTNSHTKEKTRLIIPAYMAVKLIGKGGSTIREIMKNASGSSIHVLSDKNSERDLVQVEVNIRGPLPARIEATVLILDKVNEISTSQHHTPEPVEQKPLRSPVRRSRSRSRSPRTEVSVTVPNMLVSRLIGKRGDNVKALMSRSGCIMNFQQANESEILTPEGSQARLCTVQGSTRAIAFGVKLLLEQIQEFEKRDLP
mmetsp:Transcript_9749/g.19069  ORF Transcript_9749/g.19069 Transcript_9749/m.19069 type:complete len:445 (+) Transcript_9749:1980-3314(+)